MGCQSTIYALNVSDAPTDMLNATALLIIAVGAGLRSVDFSNPNSVLITYANGSNTEIVPTNATVGRTSWTTRSNPTCPLGRVVGYYRNDADVRPEDGLKISNIPTDRYTDIVYVHFLINDEGYIRYSNPQVDLASYGIERVLALRGTGSVRRVLFGVGNWVRYGGEHQRSYTSINDTGTVNRRSIYEIWNDILDTTIARNRFAFSLVRMINRHGFDGVDIEYPWTGIGLSTPDTIRAKLMSLLKFMRNSIGRSKLLTIGPILSELMLSSNSIAQELQETVDYANPIIQSDRFSYRSAHVQPKYRVRAMIQKYLNNGYNSSFVNLGIPMLGRGYQFSATDYVNAKELSKFSEQVIVAWSIASSKYSKDGTIQYSRLLREHGTNENVYVDDEGSWILVDEEHSAISYISPRDVSELMSVVTINQLGGVTIDSIDFDVYDPPDRSIIRAVYNC